MRCNARQFLAWFLFFFIWLLCLIVESCLNQLEPRIYNECWWCLTISKYKVMYLDMFLVQWLFGISSFTATYYISYIPSFEFLIQCYYQQPTAHDLTIPYLDVQRQVVWTWSIYNQESQAVVFNVGWWIDQWSGSTCSSSRIHDNCWNVFSRGWWGG